MISIGVIIPALNPDNKLIELINNITTTTTLNNIIKKIIIVDDGSDTKHQAIFQELIRNYPDLTIRHHPQNRGKGAALKTGFAYVQKHFPDIDGVATMDSDGPAYRWRTPELLNQVCGQSAPASHRGPSLYQRHPLPQSIR